MLQRKMAVKHLRGWGARRANSRLDKYWSSSVQSRARCQMVFCILPPVRATRHKSHESLLMYSISRYKCQDKM